MGYSLSWLAVKGKSPQAVRVELGFRATGEHEKMPDSDLSAAELPNGWYLIVSNHTEQVAPDDALQRLSSGCEAVTGFVEEHVMVSSASGWKDGQRCWSVIHDSQKRRDSLETQGQLPPMFESILEKFRLKQKEADIRKRGVDFIFEVPVELAGTLVGYRHDRDVPGMSGEPFEVLANDNPIAAVADSRLQRLDQKWMALAGWQRGVIGALIVIGALFIIICAITFFVMLFD